MPRNAEQATSRPRVRRAYRIAAVAFFALLALPVILWFAFPYTSYRIYMAWLASGVRGGHGTLSAPLASQLDPHYAHDLSAAAYAYTSRLPATLAVADCTTVYFGNETIVAALRGGERPTTRQLRWLAHELTHGEQCGRWGGRKAFAKTWFAQANAQAWRVVRQGGGMDGLREWLRTRYVRDLHDAMPMEIEADARAREVLDAAP